MSTFNENKVKRQEAGTSAGGQFANKDYPANDRVGLPPVVEGECVECGRQAETNYGETGLCTSCLNSLMSEAPKDPNLCAFCGRPASTTMGQEPYCDTCLDEWGQEALDSSFAHA